MTDVQRRGIAAAFHRLAGHQSEFEDAIGNILRLAGKKSENTWMDSHSLLLNERWSQTIEFYDKFELSGHAFQLLVYQMRHAEAFQKLGLENPARPRGGVVQGPRHTARHHLS